MKERVGVVFAKRVNIICTLLLLISFLFVSFSQRVYAEEQNDTVTLNPIAFRELKNHLAFIQSSGGLLDFQLDDYTTTIEDDTIIIDKGILLTIHEMYVNIYGEDGWNRSPELGRLITVQLSGDPSVVVPARRTQYSPTVVDTQSENSGGLSIANSLLKDPSKDKNMAAVSINVYNLLEDNEISKPYSADLYTVYKKGSDTYNLYVKEYINANTYYFKFNDSAMELLTTKEKKIVVRNLLNVAEEVQKKYIEGTISGVPDENTKVEKSVVNTYMTMWFEKLQAQKEVGTIFLAVMMDSTKPDFVTSSYVANAAIRYINMAVAYAVLLIIALMSAIMILDIAYITIPVFQASDNIAVKIVSHEAKKTVKEQQDLGESGHKVIAKYFSRRVWYILILFILILYTIRGMVFDLITNWLDVISGFLNL